MAFQKRGLLVGLHITIITLASFSQPAAHQAGLVVLPEAEVQAEPAETLQHVALHGTAGAPVLRLRATAYNSLPSQTWGDPDATATGVQTRFGIIAASRDLISSNLPYGPQVSVLDPGGVSPG